jgi:hypothetical protein
MEWLLRFFLGLPPDDDGRTKAYVLADELERSGDENRRWFLPLVMLIHGDSGPTGAISPKGLAKSLRDWAGREAVAPPNENKSRLPVERLGAGPCPFGTACPLSSESSPPANAASESTPPRGNDDPDLLEILQVGGSAVRKGTNAFLEVVKRTKHCHGEQISAVVITDRFFHDSGGEDGNGEGYAVLLRLLDTIGVLKSEHPVTLYISPNRSDETFQAFSQRIVGERKGLTVKRHASVKVHDRFYILESKTEIKGKRFSGVFGPSLNGLDGALHVVGSLDETALTKIVKALKL